MIYNMTPLQLVGVLAYIIGTIVLLGSIIWKHGKMSGKVDTMMTNHLPHIEATVNELRQDIKELLKRSHSHEKR